MGSLKFPQKEDWPALLPGGVHTVTEQELNQIAVEDIDASQRRRIHFASFKVWLGHLRREHVKGKVWVCGSFMTQKPNPSDIDVILWGPTCPFVAQTDLVEILDPKKVMRTFGMDLSVEPFHQDLTIFREAHHLGFHGFANDRRTVRGIAELILE